MKTVFALAQVVEEIALGKRMVKREGEEERQNPLCKQPSIIISFLSLIVLLHIHFESVLGGLSWLCLNWISHQAPQPSSGFAALSDVPFVCQAAVDFVSCIIHKLTAEIPQVATSPSPISEAQNRKRWLYFCGKWSHVPHHKMLLMSKMTLILNTW